MIKKIQELSYSSLLTLHACPRRYQLDKLLSRDNIEDQRSVTFAFGHAVGEGIQSILLGDDWDTTLWKMFLIWDYDLLESEPRAKKSFAMATLAVMKFLDYYEYSDLSDFELATIEGKAATELSFKITLPDGYVYRGYIDAVLRHKTSNELMVLELKTTGFTNIHEAMYKNSSQALGYAIILDTIAHTNTGASFDVRYLVYKTGAKEYEAFNFTKLFKQKVDWIRDILRDCDYITESITDAHFPKRGESCYSFFRACPHMDYCNIKDSNLRLDIDKPSVSEEEYTINLNLLEIIESMEAS